MKNFILVVVLLITACGFTPTYGTKTTSSDLNAIKIDTIPDRNGQVVRNFLIDRFYDNGYPINARYNLSVSSISESIIEIGIDQDDEASRAQLRQKANMRLMDIETNKVVLERTIRATSGYNILAGQFTTFVTEQDARQQALRALSDNITTQLEIYFTR